MSAMALIRSSDEAVKLRRETNYGLNGVQCRDGVYDGFGHLAEDRAKREA